MSIGDSRGQASTFVVGAIVLALLLSMVVGGGISIGGNTYDLNLNGSSNTDTPSVPGISYAVVCAYGDGIDTEDVEITFTDAYEGEYYAVEFTSSVPIDYLVIKGGQRMEEFAFDGALSGNATFGEGQFLSVPRDNDTPCPVGYSGVKQNVDGAEENVRRVSPA